MKIFHFDKNKYNVPIQMDLGSIEKTPAFFFSPEVHCTNFFEIMMFYRGNGHILLDTTKIEIQDYTFLFISPYQKRSWYVDRKRIRGNFLIFEKDFLAEFFSDQLFVYRLQYFYNRTIPTAFVPNERLFSFEGNLFDEIRNEIHNYQQDSPHLLRSILYYILIKLNRKFCKYHQLEPNTHLNNYAYQFKEFLEQNISEKQQVNDYAKLLGISRISLNNAVKKQFGTTATEMIKERLIFEIKNELIYTTKTVAEIAFDLNFSEPNNMIRFFKSKMNTSPNQFRSTYQNDSSFS